MWHKRRVKGSCKLNFSGGVRRGGGGGGRGAEKNMDAWLLTRYIWAPLVHRLTYPKGVRSFRYFPYENTIVVCSCIYAFCLVIAIRHSLRTPNMYALSGNCNPQAKCIYAWADNNGIYIGEVPEWVYAFWVCKPVNNVCNRYSISNTWVDLCVMVIYSVKLPVPKYYAWK